MPIPLIRRGIPRLKNITMRNAGNPQCDDHISTLLKALHTYSEARTLFLSQIGRGGSCRDPLAEFSEILVGYLLRAVPAGSRVQKGYDLVKPNGRHIQVRYLANPKGKWVNEHVVDFTSGCDEYALVIFVALQLQSALVFQRETIGEVCALLGKRHPNQRITLQFTQRNYEAIIKEPSRYQALGVIIYQFSELAAC